MEYDQLQVERRELDGIVMTDHPGWVEAEPARFDRVVSNASGLSGRLVASAGSTWIEPVHESNVVSRSYAPVAITISITSEFNERLLRYRVARWRNPSLWDAIALSIVRQVIRASHARKLYRAGATAWGEEILPQRCTFPTPEKILDLDDEDFRSIGLAFQMPKLRRAAAAFIAEHEEWESLPAPMLYDALIKVPGIGPWSASVAVVDYTNDFSFYPFDDLAVRACARKLWPELNFSKSQAIFRDEWLAACDDQVATLTALTLAIGAHLDSQQLVGDSRS
ncbi:MAG TPA: hypothetical protein VGM70_07150 [Pseudolysinimonas sp.]|jgi:DNA-3-methyladenine glycosylase II